MASKTAERSNESWLNGLGATGAEADQALFDLRALIRRGLRTALSKSGSIDDPLLDELAQVAIVRVVEKLGTFRGASKFSTWAFSVAFRTAFSELRRSRWQHVSLTDFELDGEPGAACSDDVEDAETTRQRKRIREIVERAIRKKLTKRQRQAILAELAGLPLAAIEVKMGSSRNAAYKLVYRARVKLKASLLAAGLTERDLRAAFGWQR